jgi:hypothetical protein
MSDTIIVADPLNPGLFKYDYDGVRITFDDGNPNLPFYGGTDVIVCETSKPGWNIVTASRAPTTSYVVAPTFSIRIAVAPGHSRAYIRKPTITYIRW